MGGSHLIWTLVMVLTSVEVQDGMLVPGEEIFIVGERTNVEWQSKEDCMNAGEMYAKLLEAPQPPATWLVWVCNAEISA